MSTPLSTCKNQEINLYPTCLNQEGPLHVQITDGNFPEREYCIINQTGNVIRKGTIGSSTSSFSLRISGFQQGEYVFVMCKQKIKFYIQ